MADHQSSISPTSRLSRGRPSHSSSPASPISNFSRPTSTAPPVPYRPSVALDSTATTPPSRPCSIVYDNGTGVVSKEVQQHIRREGRLPRNIPRTASLQALLNKPLPCPEADFHHPVPERESFTLADVPASRAQPTRAAFVKSMAASTHVAGSPMSALISHVQDLEDNWWDTDPIETAHTESQHTHIRPVANTNAQNSPFPKPSSTRRQSTHTRPSHSRDPSKSSTRSASSHPGHGRSLSNTSIQTSEARLFHHPMPASKSISHSFPLTPSHPTHPSTALLLASPSPYVRRLIVEQPSILTALETATLPVLPSSYGLPSNPPTPWYTSWPTPPLPLRQRTLRALRTSNTTTGISRPISSADSHNHNTGPSTIPRDRDGHGGGQLSHFPRAAVFRWSKSTRAHGPATDFAHPSFAGSVAAARALWVAGYAAANYNQHQQQKEIFGASVAAPVSRLANEGRVRRVAEWEGHWLRKGKVRGVVWREERVDGGGRLAGEGEEQDEDEAGNVRERESGGLRRAGTVLGKGLRRALRRVGSERGERSKKTMEKGPKKRYTPVSPGHDHSGWYSDSSSD